jgi:hypothetical protein
MSDPRITISLSSSQRTYAPGETLAGEFTVYDLTSDEIKAMELSLLWYTEGKGEEELGVHYFERILPGSVAGFDPQIPRPFTAKLPNSPLSYDGVIVNIRWCVRVRLFLARGREILAERSFQLGTVPPAQALSPS